MATKLYLRSTSNTTTGLPTSEQSSLTSDQNAESQTTNRSLSTTAGSSQQALTLTSIATTGTREYYFTRFVSPPLNQSSIAANTWTYAFSAKQDSAQARGNFPVDGTNQPVRVNCYVWRPSTSTKVGTILDGNTASTVDEAGDGTQQSHVVTFTGSAVNSVSVNDVIIFEVWFVITQTSAVSYTDTFYYNGTTDPTENGSQTSAASYISTPENITFSSGTTTVTQTSIQKYNIINNTIQTSTHKYDILSASIVQAQSKQKYDILTSSEGFSIFFRLYVPLVQNEFLYGRRAVLFSKIDDEQVTFGYAAHVSDNGDIYFFVRDNSRDYFVAAPGALPNVDDIESPDFNTEDFNPEDYFTVLSIAQLVPNPVPYVDLCFTYEFVTKKLQIVKDGEVIADSHNRPVPAGLVDRWVLNEGTGIIANNRVRDNPAGVILNPDWQTVSGRTYLRFDDGTNRGVTVANHEDIQKLNGFTISMWYHPLSTPGVGENDFLVHKNWDNNGSFLGQYRNTGGTVQLKFDIMANSSFMSNVTVNTTLTNGQWHNIIFRWNGIDTPPEIFINNSLTTGATNISEVELDTGISQFIIGDSGNSSSPHGYIRDVVFWKRGISDDEAETIFNEKDNYPLRDNLVAEFRMNEAGDIGDDPVEPVVFNRTIYNGVTTGNNGTITNAVWDNSLDEHETYLKFDGNNDYVIINNYTAIQNLSEGTISLRYYHEGGDETWRVILGKNEIDANNSWSLFVESDDKPQFSIFNNSGTRYDVKSPSIVEENTWYHIVARWTMGSTLKLNIDNVKTIGDSTTGTLDTGATTLKVGDDDWTENIVTGKVHDVKIWNRELTDAEVTYLYNQGHPIAGFPSWQADPPPPPEIPEPITNPFEEVYHLAKPASNFTWQRLHKLIASGFSEVYNNADGVTVAESTVPFSTVYDSTVSGGGGGTLSTFYDVPNNSSGSHLEIFDDIPKVGQAFLTGHSLIGKVVTRVTPRGRREGSISGTIYCKIWASDGTERATIGSYSVTTWTTTDGDQPQFINDTNTYVIAANDIVGFEYAGGSGNGACIALIENDDPSPANTVPRKFDGSWDDLNSDENVGMKVEGVGSAGGGTGLKIFDNSHNVSNWKDEATPIVSQHITSTSSGMFNKEITRVTVKLSKAGSPTGTLSIEARDGDSTIKKTIGTKDVSTLTTTPTDYTFTDLTNTWKMTSGDKIALKYLSGSSANHVLVQASATSTVTNSAIRLNRWNINNQDNPFGGSYSWKDESAMDMLAKFETGGQTSPEKKHWYSLNGAIKGVGEKLVNSSSGLNGKKITRIAPKLRAVGNPVGTIIINIRNSSGTIVDTCGTIEADTISPSTFTEYQFTDLLQNRTLVSGDKVMIEYTGTTTNYIDVMVEHDVSHGGQLGNEQVQTWDGSAFTDVTADLSGKIYTGGTPTDVTARVRAGVKADTADSILKLDKPSRVKVWLRKVGAPPNDVTCRVRRQSDDTTRAVIGEIATSTITSEAQYTFTTSPVSVYAMQENDSLLIEYDDGDDSNYIEIAIATTDQIDSTNSHLVLYDGLFTSYDLETGKDFIATIEAGGDTFTPVGDEIPDPPPPVYTHDMHIFAGGYPWTYYESADDTTVVNWLIVVSNDVRFYRKILTGDELHNIFTNRRDRAKIPKGQIAIMGFFSLPPFS